MTHLKHMIRTGAVLASLVIGVGCAKENSGGGQVPGGNDPAAIPTPPPEPTPTPTPTPTIGDPFASAPGGVAEFTPESLARFNEYVKLHPVNNPKGYKIHVDLENVGGDPKAPTSLSPSTHRWAGSVQIAYFDNGSWYVATFESGYGTNQVSYKNRTTGRKEATFNHWYNLNGQEVFHGFFQDQHGAIVLVIDGVGGTDQGDGQSPTDLKGSIYFKNFTTSYATQSPEKCWFIRIGPYDCRSFLIGSGSDKSEWEVHSFSDPVTPSSSDGYKKLGTFIGLNKNKAFSE